MRQLHPARGYSIVHSRVEGYALKVVGMEQHAARDITHAEHLALMHYQDEHGIFGMPCSTIVPAARKNLKCHLNLRRTK